MTPTICWLAGIALVAFRHGLALPLAAWLAPVFLMRAARQSRTGRRAWLGVAGAYFLSDLLGLSGGYMPLPVAGVVAVALLGGVVWSAPYALDRLLVRRLPPLAGTLVFPAATAAIDAWNAVLSPFGSWGSPAYSQVDDLSLLQLASVTGLSGITFLVHGLAPAVNAAWERGFDLREARRPLLAWGLAIAMVLLAGAARLAFFPPSGPTLRVAGLAVGPQAYARALGGLSAPQLARAEGAVRAEWRARFAPLSQDLLARSAAAAAAGAQIVVWPESVPVLAEDLDGLLASAAALARERQVHLVVTPWVVRRSDAMPFVDSLSVLLDAAGQERWRYAKAHPVPGIEDRRMVPGSLQVSFTETTLARLAGGICFDLDFPAHVRRAGRLDADLLLAPSDDWPQIAHVHPAMARVRAVEVGASLLRPASSGISMAADYQGRVSGQASSLGDESSTLLTALPARGTRTVYSRVGGVWPFLWVGILAGLAWRARPRSGG
jgi:apolipoprotein N-acyltransferase